MLQIVPITHTRTTQPEFHWHIKLSVIECTDFLAVAPNYLGVTGSGISQQPSDLNHLTPENPTDSEGYHEVIHSQWSKLSPFVVNTLLSLPVCIHSSFALQCSPFVHPHVQGMLILMCKNPRLKVSSMAHLLSLLLCKRKLVKTACMNLLVCLVM